ncbi:MFS transporter [Meridianimarinicoccus roseus]|uniref:MFS transporter n=1 Tax=Meridianimarinicoccus roseus TaxID=2072018 RepID=A0A2V2LIC9_9RHOB|nr:MFS transporter [Meridianimarinicoccus roseus]PWR02897.1 MFS transporter [Meridianimarinicoccus roseus]
MIAFSPAFLRENAPWLTAGLLLAFSSSYGQTYFISLFAGEIMETFGLTHGQWGSIYGAGTLLSAGLMIFVGGVTDRFRVRALGAVILTCLAGACLSMSAVSAVWMLVPVIFALRFFGQGMSSHLSSVAMARWFVANRGKALAVATIGFALGESVLPITFVSLLGVVDWRLLWVVAAGLALMAIPALALLLQRERTPQSMGDHEQSPGMEGRHWTRAQVVRHPLFWCAVPLVIGPAAFITATFFHQVHLSGEKGWQHIQFVSLFPVYTVATIAGMIGSGLLIDRFGTGRLMQLYQMPLIAAFVLMGLSDGLLWGGAAMALLGLGHGVGTTLPTAFWADYFGTRHLGAIRALATAVMVLGTALGPVATGWVIDAGIGFDRQMPVIAIYFLATSLLIGVGLRSAGPLARYAP